MKGEDSFGIIRDCRNKGNFLEEMRLNIGSWKSKPRKAERVYVIDRLDRIAGLQVVIRAVHADSWCIVELSNVMLNLLRDFSSLTTR